MPEPIASHKASVAIIIVNYNAGELLKRCLEALARQTLRPRRIYVVDNASQDSSCDSIGSDFPEVDLLRLDRNAGFAAANNLAVRRAEECEWVALLNPDAFPEPAWLERLMAAAAGHPEYHFFGSRMLMADTPELLDGAGDAYHVSGLVWREGHGVPANGAYPEPREIFSPCAAAALYHRDEFLEAGGFDEDYFCYVEDVDLGFRLRLRGHRCLYVPDAIVLHKGSALTGRRSDFSIYHGHRNLTWTFVKNFPSWWFWVALPLHLCACAFSLVWFSLRGNSAAIWKAKIDAAKRVPEAWRKRRQIQAGRTAKPASVISLMTFALWP